MINGLLSVMFEGRDWKLFPTVKTSVGSTLSSSEREIAPGEAGHRPYVYVDPEGATGG